MAKCEQLTFLPFERVNITISGFWNQTAAILKFCMRCQSIAAAITERTTVQDLLEFVCSCCHLNPSVYFIRFNLPSPVTGASDSFKIPDKTTVVCSEVGRCTAATLN